MGFARIFQKIPPLIWRRPNFMFQMPQDSKVLRAKNAQKNQSARDPNCEKIEICHFEHRFLKVSLWTFRK
jgi:hypothetical protein